MTFLFKFYLCCTSILNQGINLFSAYLRIACSISSFLPNAFLEGTIIREIEFALANKSFPSPALVYFPSTIKISFFSHNDFNSSKYFPLLLLSFNSIYGLDINDEPYLFLLFSISSRIVLF